MMKIRDEGTVRGERVWGGSVCVGGGGVHAFMHWGGETGKGQPTIEYCQLLNFVIKGV